MEQFAMVAFVQGDQLSVRIEQFPMMALTLLQALLVPGVQPRRDLVLADDERGGTDQDVAEDVARDGLLVDPELVEVVHGAHPASPCGEWSLTRRVVSHK